jgi:hypothetical protein
LRPINREHHGGYTVAAVDGAALDDNPPLFANVASHRRLRSRQLTSLAIHRLQCAYAFTYTATQCYPVARIRLSCQFFHSYEFRASVRQSSLQPSQQEFGNRKQPQINRHAIPYSIAEYINLASDASV